ncbi:MAG: excinuclease ABC subunit UvrA [Planctomycetaceae bacterium]|nr:excinuclease ABC subunit UvrA [Planctomycetaceae bacterium]
MSDIIIKGAREHNLRDVELRLPRNQLICFTGVSGSGKSSLAFDTLYAEGQRRYIESLSSFARQFLGQLPKPDVDQISGLSPSISISQKAGGQNTRSTVGTITEIYDFLRVLYARTATGYCYQCGKPIAAQTRQQIIDRIETLPENTRFLILAPVIRGQKGEHKDLFADLLKKGFLRARVDGEIVRLSQTLQLDRQMRHNIDVVIDRLTQTGASGRQRLSEAVERALAIGDGQLIVTMDFIEKDSQENSDNKKKSAKTNDFSDIALSANYACSDCGISFEPPSPQMFSFNSPQGMCPHCEGLGEFHSFDSSLLIPDATKNFQQGCVVPIGKWRDMGRWRRHIFSGVAEWLERKYDLPKNHVLETAWEEVDERVKKAMLWGTGDSHITFTWRNGVNGHKWGGTYEGIIPRMMSQYRETKSKMQKAAMEKYMNVIPCEFCKGKRLSQQACSFKLETLSDSPIFRKNKVLSLPEVCSLQVTECAEFFSMLNLSESGQKIAVEALKEIRNRLGFLVNVGLDYLSLDRTAPTLSGGELQRIRLAGQIGSGLVGVLYILDEPSIGLHPRDNDRLITTLQKLRDQGNTVIVVEHDEETMLASDYLVDFGPGPGVHGGNIVASGNIEQVLKNPASLTGKYLNGQEKIAIPSMRRSGSGEHLVVRGATHNNLKNIDIDVPLGKFVCVTGVSGSGKSSFVNDILVESLMRDLNGGLGTPGEHAGIDGLEHLDKMISIDQSPIGRTPRSNPATYIKLFDEIRKLYSELPDARAKGFTPGRFSFNVEGGRCEACEGNGSQKLEMDFLADVWVTCPVCQGRRFNLDTLSVKFKGKSVDQVLDMGVEEALEHFANIPKIRHKIATLAEVGLGYMKIGQPSPTLSGGEAQRIKLARELVKKSTGRTLYLLDEPTTGLHFADIRLLLKVLHDFVDAGNTVLVVEHNLDVIKTADWIIDLGPEGGAAGGNIVAIGTPEDVANYSKSHTGKALKKYVNGGDTCCPITPKANETIAKVPVANSIVIRNAEEHNLKAVSIEIPRDQMTVCCGPSGSGKSSLAMDTVYAEGQRRYVESLSSYARQFVGQLQKPRVEQIEGLSPAIAIEQKAASHSPRSTVGTVTEIHDYLRVLFARLGQPYCPECDVPIGTQTLDEIVAKIMQYPPETRLLITAPLSIEVGKQYGELWGRLRSNGYNRVRIDGVSYTLDDVPEIDRRRKHQVEVIVDRIVVHGDHSARSRISDSVETALELGEGVMYAIVVENKDDDVENKPNWTMQRHSRHFACEKCGRSFEPLSPNHFSFNSPIGWCPQCEGLGVQTGANPALFLHDTKLTLEQGAVRLFPKTTETLAAAMLHAFSQSTGVPLNVPFEQLDARHKRLIFHGTGERWIDCRAQSVECKSQSAEHHVISQNASTQTKTKTTLHSTLHTLHSFSFRFQYKGLYPTLEAASRLLPSLRGKLEYMVDEVECPACLGSRYRDDVAAVRFLGMTMDQMCRQPLGQLLPIIEAWRPNETERKVAGDLMLELRRRLQFLIDVGLDYLTLARPAPSLSGGETQRIRLAAQIGSGLVGVLYVLDEPTIGLHPRDNSRLVAAIKKLRDLGNTLLLVEHDKEVIENADMLIDFGPKAGRYGGEIVASGSPSAVAKQRNSVTGPYLSGQKAIPVPSNRRIKI